MSEWKRQVLKRCADDFIFYKSVIENGLLRTLINCNQSKKELNMQDCKVRHILSNVRDMSVSGKSPVDYIDGVLDTIPEGFATTEQATIKKQPILGADYGPNDAKPLF
jgi:hypothetical protein